MPNSRHFSVDFSRTLIFRQNPINADNVNAHSTPLLKTGSGLMPSSSNNNMIRISLANQNYDLSAIEKGEGELTDSLDLSGSLVDSEEERKEMTEEQYIKTLTGKFIKNKRELSKAMTHIKWQKYLNQ